VLFSETLLAALECLLFVAAEPLSIKNLANILETKEKDTEELLDSLARKYNDKESGIQLVRLAGGYQLCTRPEFSGYIEKLYKPQAHALSRAALETLAIVAYRQPITRAEMEQIRGVKVDGVVNTLMEKKLIQEIGRKEGPGRPILYGTSGQFLQYFGLDDLEDLPDPEKFLDKAAVEEAAASQGSD